MSNENYSEKVARPNKRVKSENGLLLGIVVSTSDCQPRGPGFDLGYTLKLFLERNRTGCTQPREGNRVVNSLTSSEILFRKRKLKFRDDALLTTRPPALAFGSNSFSRCSFFGSVVPRIYMIYC